jgi:hypothetical protein
MGFGIPGVCGNETGLDAMQVLGEWRILRKVLVQYATKIITKASPEETLNPI